VAPFASRSRHARRTGHRTEEDTIVRHAGRCEEAHLGCPCRGDETIHEERSRALAEARADSAEAVECPECGGPTTPLAIVSWGNCRACRTAHSRSTHPLRW
jgi:hypothetical protein